MAKKRAFNNLESRQIEMKKRNLTKVGELEKFFDRKRPAHICPICFLPHSIIGGGVPEQCFIKAVKSDATAMWEFEQYLKKNKLGRFR